MEEVSKDMKTHDTFDSVHVGVNVDGSEQESDPYFNGLGPLCKGCIKWGVSVAKLKTVCLTFLFML